jgi:predicted nucleic acid-binding protein
MERPIQRLRQDGYMALLAEGAFASELSINPDLPNPQRILPITAKIADRWGRPSPSRPLPAVDGMIAATGLEYQLIVVTRNVAEFQRSGAHTLNPFAASPG